MRTYDGLLICAAGNDDTDIDTSLFFPATFGLDNQIVVGAMTSAGTRRADSNSGIETVHLFAPGDNILTTGINSDYVTFGATSGATPFVTGVAALIKSLHPTMSAQRIKEIILESADWDSNLAPYCITGGRLNAYQALLLAGTPPLAIDVNIWSSVGRQTTEGMVDSAYDTEELDDMNTMARGLYYTIGQILVYHDGTLDFIDMSGGIFSPLGEYVECCHDYFLPDYISFSLPLEHPYLLSRPPISATFSLEFPAVFVTPDHSFVHMALDFDVVIESNQVSITTLPGYDILEVLHWADAMPVNLLMH